MSPAIDYFSSPIPKLLPPFSASFISFLPFHHLSTPFFPLTYPHLSPFVCRLSLPEILEKKRER